MVNLLDRRSDLSIAQIDGLPAALRQLCLRAPLYAVGWTPHSADREPMEAECAPAFPDWDAVRDYKVTGSNSYSKMVARYRQDLLAVHAASEAAQ
jgi:hypothetical protein